MCLQAPRAASDTARLKQLASLEEWAASLRAKMLIAVRADRREQALEGLYWLAVRIRVHVHVHVHVMYM